MSNLDTLTFEDAINELELTVKKLEIGECTLDDSIELFERGIELSKYCYDKIDAAKLKIEKISLTSEEIGANE